MERHRQFINAVDGKPACFKRVDMPEFNDQEFADHIAVAEQDKYVTQSADTFCTMQALSRLVSNIKRIQDEQVVL